MNRRFLALLPWMATAGAAWGQLRSADVLYTHKVTTPVRSVRVGDECFVPIDALSYWNWKAERNGDTAQVNAEGANVTVPARVINGRAMIAIRRAVEQLGGKSEWIATTDQLQIYAPVKSLTVKEDGTINAKSLLSIKATGFTLSNPDRAIVDLEGARLDKDTKLDLPKGAKATQYRTNVVRVVVELPYVPNPIGTTAKPGRELSFALKPSTLPSFPEDDKPEEPIVEAPAVLPINLLSDDAKKTVISLPLEGRIKGPATFNLLDPLTLEVTLPFVQGFLPESFLSPTTAIVGFEATRKGFDTVLTLHLAKTLGAAVETGPEGVTISLVTPTKSTGLAGKIVIVDPGHGGSDTGAKSGGVYEKTLTLAVSKLLTAELTKAGATVIMTRSTDVFIPLGIRSDIANRNAADLFISVHINSTARPASQSGTISFHHKNNEVGRQLAASIQAEMAKVNGLPDKGVWSDGRIYNSGFAVLRNTRQRAAVLLELGFINHPKDRGRMTTDDFKTKIAAAITRGIRNYLGDTTP